MASRSRTTKSGKGPVEDILKRFIAEDGLAVYAARAGDSRGRLYPEVPSKTRGPFERDRDRVIHSQAFRRLKFKTQVFVYHEGDHYRTRLSHSIEVAQVARSLARLLHADEDLAETCALAHDLGHPPFAHVGEDALKECMQPYGDFDHNDQTLRLVTVLEKKYPHFDGLNLSWESLEGLVKHNGPAIKKNKKVKLPITLDWLKDEMDLMLTSHAGIEAQIAGIADDIAYNSHDLDDGLNAGLFTLKDLEEVEWVGEIIRRKRKDYPGTAEKLIEQEVIRDVMGAYVLDVLAETKKNLIALKPKEADDLRHAGKQTVMMSEAHKRKDRALREFLWSHFYRHHYVSRERIKTFRVVRDLFKAFMDHRRCLPTDVLKHIENVPKGWDDKTWQARNIADYIASMTDRMAVLEHKDLYDISQVIR